MRDAKRNVDRDSPPLTKGLFSVLMPNLGNASNDINRPFPDGMEFLSPSLPDYHEFEKGSDEEIFSRHLVHLWTTFAIHQ